MSFVSRSLAAISEFSASLPQADLFAALGLFSLVVLSALLLFLAIRFAFKISHSWHQLASLRAMRIDDTPGLKIMVARMDGTQGMSLRKNVLHALEHFLPEFNFGAPFYLGSFPVKFEVSDIALSGAEIHRLQDIFKKSNADLIVWGEARGRVDETTLCFATPRPSDKTKGIEFFPVTFKGSASSWGEKDYRALAYVAGRRLRPSLGKPADFRAERLQPIVRSMEKLLESESVLTGRSKTELEDDFAAGALHIGEQLKDIEWLEKSVDFRQRSLESLQQGEQPLRWAQAKIDLGRALMHQCEYRFEPIKLQDAMKHLREGIDSTKNDAHMRLTETGIAALQQAETMLANRRRFSIRWNV
ncbi:MAG: hypothetical protein CMK09_02725 [Ponticaulis sp.]|nr:hypothetical protein [Ponticaulis sp.]